MNGLQVSCTAWLHVEIACGKLAQQCYMKSLTVVSDTAWPAFMPNTNQHPTTFSTI